ncbi:MAG: potassium channel family protein [Chloroflexota bacterium]
MARPVGEAGVRDALLALLGAPGLRRWVAIVASAVAAGTAGYMAIEGWSFLDAIYMTIISVTTVGFKEVHELDVAGRVWTMIISVAGVVLIFGTVGLVTEYLIIEATSGRSRTRRMAEAVGALGGHYAQNVCVILSARALNRSLLVVGRAGTPSAERSSRSRAPTASCRRTRWRAAALPSWRPDRGSSTSWTPRSPTGSSRSAWRSST